MECFVQKQFYNYWWFERVWQLVLSVNLPQLKIIWVGSLNGGIILIDMEGPQKTWVPHSASNPNKKGSCEWRKTSKFLSLGVFSCHWVNLFTLVLLMLLLLLPPSPSLILQKVFLGFWNQQRNNGSSQLFAPDLSCWGTQIQQLATSRYLWY